MSTPRQCPACFRLYAPEQYECAFCATATIGLVVDAVPEADDFAAIRARMDDIAKTGDV